MLLEMADIFGEELQEYDDGSSSSSSKHSDSVSGSASQSLFAQDAAIAPTAADARLDVSRFASRALENEAVHVFSSPPPSPRTAEPRSFGATHSSVLVLEGPCSYVRGVSVRCVYYRSRYRSNRSSSCGD